MPMKKHKSEQIVSLLRQIEIDQDRQFAAVVLFPWNPVIAPAFRSRTRWERNANLRHVSETKLPRCGLRGTLRAYPPIARGL